MSENTEMNVEPVRIVVINAGVSDPSSTRMLADRIAQRSVDRLKDLGRTVSISMIDLAPIATDIAKAVVAGFTNEAVSEALGKIAKADAVIAATPVYKAGISGLFKSFVDLMDNDLLIARPMVLAATAGTSRHAMVLDDQMRPLFAFMRALPVPTSVFAAPEDWASTDLGRRIDRAGAELASFVGAGVGSSITDKAWGSYQHQFGSSAARAEQGNDQVDFGSDLMRLATGGTL
jgi:FMN reductase